MLEHRRRIIRAKCEFLDNPEERERWEEVNNFKVEMIIFPYKLKDYMEKEKEQERKFMECVKNGKEE